jgi:hypothetical protein
MKTVALVKFFYSGWRSAVISPIPWKADFAVTLNFKWASPTLSTPHSIDICALKPGIFFQYRLNSDFYLVRQIGENLGQGAVLRWGLNESLLQGFRKKKFEFLPFLYRLRVQHYGFSTSKALSRRERALEGNAPFFSFRPLK